MKAMVLRGAYDLSENDAPLELLEIPTPEPAEGEILIRVLACGVCHTDMDEAEGRVIPPSFPVVPGHQAVGVVSESGKGAENFDAGEMVGVAWIGGACGKCSCCGSGRENLCHDFIATGRDRDGGFAEFMVADADFVHRIPEGMDPVKTAPFLCAGAIGRRCVRLCGITDGDAVGLMGFGASAHLVIQLLRHSHPLSEVFVFARGERERLFAISKENSDIDSLLSLDYQSHLWLEKEIKSAANVTREDVAGFLSAASALGIEAEVTEYGLEEANAALSEMKRGAGRGARVLRIAER